MCRDMHASTPLFVSMAVLFAIVGCAAEPANSDDGAAGSMSQAGAASTSGGSGPGVAGTTGSSSGSPGSSGSGAGGPPGTAGTGGTMLPPAGCTPVDTMTLLSDFETGKAEVLPNAGRDGSWFLYSDGTGMQTPVKVPNTPLVAEAGGACGSAYAFHTTGTGFTVWGAGIGTDFAPKTGMARTQYDLSAYSGIALRAKSAATMPLRVSISDANTSPEGMVCVDTTDATNMARCGDYFGAEVTLGTEYQDFVIKFADLKQRGWGLPVATGFDKTKAYTLRMQVKGSAQAPATFDLWFDDIRLVP
jgi:hypothetical protein